MISENAVKEIAINILSGIADDKQIIDKKETFVFYDLDKFDLARVVLSYAIPLDYEIHTLDTMEEYRHIFKITKREKSHDYIKNIDVVKERLIFSRDLILSILE